MSAPRSRSVFVALGGILLFGAVLRLAEYLEGRPLWGDELTLALNLGRRSFGGLLTTLDYDQVAPILFLWTVKAISLLAGFGEYSLRLLPLLSGLLLPWVIWRMARTLAGIDVALIASGLAAVSVPLIYYAGELKPYATDALVSASLLLLTQRARAAPERAASWWQLGLGGLLALVASLPAPFLLAGALAALLADSRVRNAAGVRKRLAAAVTLWAIGFLILNAAVYPASAANLFLQRFWEGTFLDPRAPDLSERILGFVNAVSYPISPSSEMLRMRWRLVALLLGLLLLIRRSKVPAGLLIGIPFLVLGAAAALGRYPVAGRLFLALAPCAFVALAVLIAELLRLLTLRQELAAVVGMLLVVLAAAPEVIANGRMPLVMDDGRETARAVVRAPVGEPVYILAAALPAWAYYSTDWNRPNLARLGRYASLGSASGPAPSNSLLAMDTVGAPLSSVAPDTGRAEVIGARSGVAYREPVGFVQDTPDVGWAGREADRIAAVARPYAWIYGTHWSRLVLPSLRAELNRRDVIVVEAMQENVGVALRVRSRLGSR